MKRIDRLIEAIGRTGAAVALGLDTRPEYLPDGFARDAGGIRAFNFALIDALADIVPCVKVQAAVYEALGLPGMEAFRDTLARAAEKGMVTIADVKRNDIGATAEAYAAAYLGSPSGSELPPFAADFVTVNAYLGADGVSPFLDACEKTGRGVFALTRTSNPSAGEFQDLTVRGSGGIERPLYEEVGLRVESWGKNLMGERGYSSVGAVVGATWPEEGKRLRKLMPHAFFLVPGYGTQGASAGDLAGCFDEEGGGAIVNASRSLLLAYRKPGAGTGKDFAEAVRDEAERMREDIRSALAESRCTFSKSPN